MKRSVAVAAAMFFAGLGVHAAQSSCVSCHSDPDAIKALFQPPTVAATEAEG